MLPLQKLLTKKTRLCIGLMSGTSMDGVDAALVRITGSGLNTKLTLIDWQTYPYPRGLKEQLLECIASDSIALSALSQLNFLIGELFADAVEKLLEKCGIKSTDVDLVGTHGQTVWHNPEWEKIFNKQICSTLQIGEPSVIQARTGIITVADFRVKDVAQGGSGAPLIPYCDYLLFRSKKEHRGMLNIGGIANITVVPANSDKNQVYAFDTGPGNMLIDQLMQELYGEKSDRDGRIAKKAQPDRRLLSKLMRHPFISKSPPKSTGREEFGAGYVKKIREWAENLQLSSEETISTVSEFTAKSIAKNYDLFIKLHHSLYRLIVSGGGVHNRELMQRLRRYFPDTEVETTDKYGIPPDIKEAVAFALFASETIVGNPVNIPGVTGAQSPAILGKIIP